MGGDPPWGEPQAEHWREKAVTLENLGHPSPAGHHSQNGTLPSHLTHLVLIRQEDPSKNSFFLLPENPPLVLQHERQGLASAAASFCILHPGYAKCSEFSYHTLSFYNALPAPSMFFFFCLSC